jgi:hypothetical protein
MAELSLPASVIEIATAATWAITGDQVPDQEGHDHRNALSRAWQDSRLQFGRQRDLNA